MEEKNVNEVESNHVSEDSSPPEKNEANNNESSEKVSEKSSENVLNEAVSEKSEDSQEKFSSEKGSALSELVKLSKKKFPIPIQKKRKSSDSVSVSEETGNASDTIQEDNESFDDFQDDEEEESEFYTSTGTEVSISTYEETVLNRLDNILTCAIITACCAILILFHTLKKE